MKLRRCFGVLFISLIIAAPKSNAQDPTSSFLHVSPVCQQQNIELTNNSTNGTNFDWDFCEGDLLEPPSASNVLTLSATNSPRYLDVVLENSVWYGFVTSRNNHSLLRLTFGTSLDNTPSVENLGNVGGLLNSPEPIKVLEDNGSWYAMIHNGGNNSIIRVSFGNSLANTPTATMAMESIGESNSRMEFIQTSSGYYALLSYWNSNTLDIIDFNNTLNNNPTSGDILITSSISGATNIIDISLIESEGNWYGILVAYGSKTIHTLDFGPEVYSDPAAANVTSTHIYGYNPYGIDLEIDNGKFIGYMTSINGELVQLNFGESITDGIDFSQDLGNMGGIIQNTWNIALRKENSNWFGFSVDGSKKHLYKIEFPNICNTDIETSNELEPNLLYSASGTYNIGLRVSNDNFQTSRSVSSITVTSNTAPSISFSGNGNECLGQENTFTPSNLSLDSYSWDYTNNGLEDDDATIGSLTFGSTGDHIVSLTVNDGTCSNFIKDTISIYPEPVTPTFSTPGAPYCTGADLAFENLFDKSNYSGATLTYDWDYNSEGNSNERDGTFAFDSEGTKTITLTASIPGCSALSAGTDINVIAGPDVDFIFEELCLGDDTQFTNGTTGTGITGQTWNFGDGIGTSSASSPTYSYAAHGNYEVSLTVNNNQGCSNELTLPITIDDKPVASFNHGPACEGVDISFLDESSVDGLANITSYEWDFEGLGTSTNQNPNFTFNSQGSYDVELVVETTAGCRDTVTSTVNVLLAPAANFEVDLGCINTETIFLDKSEGDFSNPITQWIWTIDGSLASYSSSFGEVYNDAGDHTISLLVRSANSCQSVHNDNFTINELPVVDFTLEKACDNESTVFQDATNSAAIESYSWQFGNQGSSTSNPATHQFSSAGSYTVGLNIVDETGCEGSIQKSVTIHPSPTAIINASSDIGPAPLMIDFTDESQSTQSSFWLFGDEDESTSSENNPQFTYNDEGDYTAQLISTNDLGCSDTTSLAVTVADPILDLELVQISTEESEEKTSVSLTVRNSGNVILHGFDIRIDLDNNSSIFESYAGTITRGKSITYPLNFTFSSVGNNIGYTCITLLDRVEEFEDINIVNNESCINFNQQLIIENSYPNPVRSTDTKIRFNMILPADGPVQIFLLNATGAVLYQETYMEAKAGLNSFFLDIYSFEQGMYFIKTVYDQNESTQRFVKM
ncbi:MAG: PKD domain-containing protein [Reichenbachiella sp.]|uniref:PKD domain-containing protein n=1 Tax=Reichenbachiella sp. TaxID=2184521 RepID=UPI00329993B8